RRPDVPMETFEKYLHSLYRMRPDFVYSVSRDFAKSCQTPMLVLPDDVTAHPLQVSIDIASLAPNAEITVFPWKDPPELKARTINRARTFLKRCRRKPATYCLVDGGPRSASLTRAARFTAPPRKRTNCTRSR